MPGRGRELSCARCGAVFRCNLGNDCWCAAEPVSLPVQPVAGEDCLCPTCLRKAASAAVTARSAN